MPNEVIPDEAPYEIRKKLIDKIEQKRSGRRLISLFDFDRLSDQNLPGLSKQFNADLKECLYGILRDIKSKESKQGIDLFLYTRGGDTNSVWPIVSLIREYDPDFEVIVPFRAHSAGTLLAIAAKKICMTRLSELSPIDPSTGNHFNPIDPMNQFNRLGISVEDVKAYKDFIGETFKFKKKDELSDTERSLLEHFVQSLVSSVHPLAIGNVHRVHKLISRLAEKLLLMHHPVKDDHCKIIEKLTVEPYSHVHMFNRNEAQEILGKDLVVFVDDELEQYIDELLREYEKDFSLREPLFLPSLMQKPEEEVRFISGVIESKDRSYLFETKGKIFQFSKLPPNVNVQIPAGQPMPLVPGLPREYRFEVCTQRWHRNIKKEGITK
jgi:hypothetical protein